MTLSTEQISQARRTAAAARRRIVDVLEESVAADPDGFTARLAATLRLEVLSLAQLRAAAPAFDLLPLSECAQRGCALLRAEGAAISAYYSPPLHRSEHCPAGVATPALPVAEELARNFVQLPVGELTTVADVDAICGLLAFVAENGAGAAKRYAGRGQP